MSTPKSLALQIENIIRLQEDRNSMIFEDQISGLWRRVLSLEKSLRDSTEALTVKKEQLGIIIRKYSLMHDRIVNQLKSSQHENLNATDDQMEPNGDVTEIQDTYAAEHIQHSFGIQSSSDLPSQIYSNPTTEMFVQPQSLDVSKKRKLSRINNPNHTNSFAANKLNKDKFIDVVRSKAARAALPGHECLECSAFYKAMLEQGIFSTERKLEMLQECSRHKSRW